MLTIIWRKRALYDDNAGVLLHNSGFSLKLRTLSFYHHMDFCNFITITTNDLMIFLYQSSVQKEWSLLCQCVTSPEKCHFAKKSSSCQKKRQFAKKAAICQKKKRHYAKNASFCPKSVKSDAFLETEKFLMQQLKPCLMERHNYAELSKALQVAKS